MSDLPDPMVPPEVNLRGLPWMRLDTSRLMDSDLFALSSGDEFKAAVALWCKAWSQSPGGSLPGDERILAELSRAGSKWSKVKAIALRGWVKCSDGRLYHPVVAEQALLAWKERVEYMGEKEQQNKRQRESRAERAEKIADLKEKGVNVKWNTPMHEIRGMHAELCRAAPVQEAGLSQPVTVTGGDQSQRHHTFSHGLDGTGRDGKSFKSSSPDIPQRADTSSGVAAEMARALRLRGFPECADTFPDLVALADEGYTLPEVIEAADAAARVGGKPIGWIATRIRGRRKDAMARAAETGQAPTPAAQAQISERDRAKRDAEEAYDRAIRMHHNDVGNRVITAAEGRARCARAKSDLEAALAALGFDAIEDAA